MNNCLTIEFKSLSEIKKIQEEALQKALLYLHTHSPYYKKLFYEKKIDISKIKTIDSLQHIPTTSKNQLQKYNDDFFCVNPTEIIDYATTSGTLGVPVTFGLTEADLQRLAYNEAISFACAGVQKGDIVQLMTTMDRRFMAGLAYFLGLRRLGAGIVRVGAGIPEMQWDSIFKYKPKYLVGVPSFLLTMIQYAITNGIKINETSVKGVICIGEPIRNQDFTPNILHQKITEKWNVKLFSTYASTEMSTAFTECPYQQGGHSHPELIITEILDENEQPVPEGQFGELTVTTLGVQAMPLLRFKTGDIVRLHTEPCPCGRNTPRISPVLGRKQQMIKYKGTTIYPPAMHDLLNHFEEIKHHLIEITTTSIGTDQIVLKVSTLDASQTFINKIKDHFRAKLRVSPSIEIVSESEILKLINNPKSRKPILFIDNRKTF